jgi:zinc D-Ala-D-Ala dipeptidase
MTEADWRAGKRYRLCPIRECGEPLVRIPTGVLGFKEPHPYIAAGAPYGEVSPWMLRESILASLVAAQARLQARKAGWRILLTDAFRPCSVQEFMVNRERALQAAAMGFSLDSMSDAEHEAVNARVFRLWAIPSADPATPPPHSTGAAFDCTLVDEAGCELDMGSPVDENSERSMPDHFVAATDPEGALAHELRTLLKDVLTAEGFVRHPCEWWHFSRGDQLATWDEAAPQLFAIYGQATEHHLNPITLPTK